MVKKRVQASKKRKNSSPRDSTSGGRYFGEPKPTPGEVTFVDQTTDTSYYRLVNSKLLQPLPEPKVSPPRIDLSEVIGATAVEKIQSAGKIVFHSVGDTGATFTAGPVHEAAVTDKMAADFDEVDTADVPSFMYHLGDVIYNFGEDEYYYDQFYEPFRNYEAPIFAIPGNHDGVIYRGDQAATLAAFLQHFCSDSPVHAPQAGGLVRTTMTQPGVYFTLTAPFVTLIGLYSNVLEDPGVISSEGGKNPQLDDRQKQFLTAELKNLKDSNYGGAIILAVHHPPYTVGSIHGGSPQMEKDIEDAIQAAGGFWPHVVLSGHVHDYQRYTKVVGQQEIPFIIAGSGGHDATPIRLGKGNTVIRTPVTVGDVTLERYYPDYGYLRIVVDSKLLSIEFHDVSTGLASKSPADVCTVDLQSRTLSAHHV
jgi:hypothetical protein